MRPRGEQRSVSSDGLAHERLHTVDDVDAGGIDARQAAAGEIVDGGAALGSVSVDSLDAAHALAGQRLMILVLLLLLTVR